MKKGLKVLIIPIFAILFLVASVSCSAKDPILLVCNGLSISQSTFLLRMTEIAVEMQGEEGITAENLVEKAKERTLTALKAYTYYKQGYTNLHYTLSEEDRITYRADILSSLVASGLQYEASRRDAIFLENFGVSFEQYMVYREESLLIDYFFNQQVEQIQISQEEQRQFFSEHQAEYAICTADAIYIEAETEVLHSIAEEIKSRLQNQVAIAAIKEEFKDAVKKTGNFTFDLTSNLDDSFGKGFVAKLTASKPGEIITVESQQGISIARTVSIAGYEENLKQIEAKLKEKKYIQQVEKAAEAYTMEIADQEAYEAIQKIPGTK